MVHWAFCQFPAFPYPRLRMMKISLNFSRFLPKNESSFSSFSTAKKKNKIFCVKIQLSWNSFGMFPRMQMQTVGGQRWGQRVDRFVVLLLHEGLLVRAVYLSRCRYKIFECDFSLENHKNEIARPRSLIMRDSLRAEQLWAWQSYLPERNYIFYLRIYVLFVCVCITTWGLIRGGWQMSCKCQFALLSFASAPVIPLATCPIQLAPLSISSRSSPVFMRHVSIGALFDSTVLIQKRSSLMKL